MEMNMQLLIEKELKSTDKILKPDFNSKSGRELLAFYLQTKFRQIYLYDKKQEVPIINLINADFINKFCRRLINKPTKCLFSWFCMHVSGMDTIYIYKRFFMCQSSAF